MRAWDDLRSFIEALDHRGELHRVKASVSRDLEITEVADRLVKKGGPALLFENVQGSPYPVAINLFGTMDRVKFALGDQNIDALGEELFSLLSPPEPLRGFWDKLKALPKLAELSHFFPKVVNRAPVQEVVEEPDLDAIPVLKCWPDDGGPFITLPLVISKDPVTGQQNLGMYRLQVFDRKTTGMHWHLHKDGAHQYRLYREKGQRMEVAVAIGGDPATIYAATAPLPRGVDEFLLAGFLRKSPVELVKAKTVDLLVPARAEFILEGYVDLEEKRREGPFGDHTGFYSAADDFPVFHVTTVTRRREPIYPATIVGRPIMEDANLGKVTERLFLPLIRMQLPEVVDMSLPVEGVFHNLAIVSIKKEYPGQARKVMQALWGLGQMMFTKMIVIVDADVNVQDHHEVAWQVLSNIDPRRDTVIVDGPVDVLDHSAPSPLIGSKMGLDATRKGPAEGHHREWPEIITMSPEIQELVNRRWREYGL